MTTCPDFYDIGRAMIHGGIRVREQICERTNMSPSHGPFVFWLESADELLCLSRILFPVLVLLKVLWEVLYQNFRLRDYHAGGFLKCAC